MIRPVGKVAVVTGAGRGIGRAAADPKQFMGGAVFDDLYLGVLPASTRAISAAPPVTRSGA